MQIGILGGTGPAGSALAARLASIGIEAVVGSRSSERAAETCARITEQWPGRDLPIRGGDNATAAGAEVVVVATPWDGAGPTAVSVADHLRGKVVISMANALARVGTEFQPVVPPRGSVAAHVQALVPDCLVVGAFHHLPARELGAIDRALDADVLICSDHPEATEVASELTSRVPGLRALDCGSLSNAMAIEAMTTVLLQLNGRYKTRAALRITGIGEHVGAPARAEA